MRIVRISTLMELPDGVMFQRYDAGCEELCSELLVKTYTMRDSEGAPIERTSMQIILDNYKECRVKFHEHLRTLILGASQ